MKFSIRDVLWLTVVVAMGVGWGISGWREYERHQRTIEALEERILDGEANERLLAKMLDECDPD